MTALAAMRAVPPSSKVETASAATPNYLARRYHGEAASNQRPVLGAALRRGLHVEVRRTAHAEVPRGAAGRGGGDGGTESGTECLENGTEFRKIWKASASSGSGATSRNQ